MKKLKNKRLFLIIGISLLLLIIAFTLESLQFLHFSEIKAIKLYQNKDYSFGAAPYFNTPIAYSRIWDLAITPVYLFFLIKMKKIAQTESKIIILASTLLLIMLASYFFVSLIFSIYASAFFIIIVSIYFGEKSALFLSLSLGLVFGLAVSGLIYGLILALITYLATLLIREML